MLDEINDGEEAYITEHPEVAGRIVEEKAVRLLNYSLLIIQNADSMGTSEMNNKENEIEDKYRSADLRLNKILKLFSSSSSLSDFEILALISSIDVKLKLSLIEDWVPLLRSFESLIKDIQKSKGIVLSEVLRQYNQYFKSKLIIEEEIYKK